uniref:G-protein coupled receptors family 1 profile domain-containing protein n=1 Tax=Sus scrofa TaxID=9823 RepID=A0A4X1STG6_PIG
MEPRSNMTCFILLGLTQNPKEQKVLFVIFLLFYIVTVVGNLLSFMDVTYSSSFTLRLISDLLFGENIISFESCMTQLFIDHFFGGSEVFLLLVIAYDCYEAICKPLNYLVIMRQRVCVALLLLSSVGGFLHSVIQFSTIYGLPFCGPNVIDHFLFVANGGMMRWKALQTCVSHITVVVCFFVLCIFIHVRPAKTFPIDKSLNVFFTFITPMLNPLIYSLRNSEMTNAMKNLSLHLERWNEFTISSQ